MLPIVTEIAAEHRMYLPLAGIIALVVLGLFTSMLAGLRRRVCVAAAVVASVSSPRMTYAAERRLSRLRSHLVRDDRRAPAQCPRPEQLRHVAADEGTVRARPKRHLRVAVAEQPSFAEAEANLGVALSAQGRLEDGADHLRTAVALRPDYASAHRNLGETYAMQHRLDEALAHYTKALEKRPDNIGLLNRAAWIMATASNGGDP